ncbi:hypothetical protein [Herbidospora cretacea]|uniref:hypothetical protein n=1 Tax=Herbidospora cretacea TaxID=28444 RepID=UPI000773A4CA|nr:hypothetical protein [Herbidospora cretacea]
MRFPDDEHLSRRAGSLVVLDDCVLIRNESRQKPLVVRPPAGEDRVVEPGAATASLPFPLFSLVFAGAAGAAVTVNVDARAVTPGPGQPGAEPPTASPETVTPPLALTRAQRLMLAALCEPLLVRAGPGAVPATYAQVGARLDRQPGYVRNVLKALRENLSGHGVPGLTSDDDGAAHDDFRWALARWAVRTGTVTSVDLEDLPEGRGER